MLPSFGVEVRFAKDDSAEAIAALIDDNTKAVYCESIGNPTGNIVDLAAFAKVAHARGVPLIVDNTVATPVLCKPIEHGADIVVHSLTKYVGGHGNSLGRHRRLGQVPLGGSRRALPQLTKPEPSYHGVVYTEAFGPTAFIGRVRTVPLRNTGAALAPMNAFLLLQGLETLSLRMERHVDNALRVAHHLKHHPKVAWVSYAGLPGHPTTCWRRNTWPTPRLSSPSA